MRHLIYDRNGRRKSYASDLNPRTILGANLKVWFRADKSSTLSGSRVTQLTDLVSGAVLVEDATGANYVSSTATLNGQPSLSWSATNAYEGTVAGPTLAQPWAWGVVYSISASGFGFGCNLAGSGYAWYITTFADSSISIYTRHPDASEVVGICGAGTALTNTASWAELCSATPSGRYNSTVAGSSYKTGTAQALNVAPDDFHWDSGGTFSFAEFVGVSGVTDLAALAPYLAQRYGIRR